MSTNLPRDAGQSGDEASPRSPGPPRSVWRWASGAGLALLFAAALGTPALPNASWQLLDDGAMVARIDGPWPAGMNVPRFFAARVLYWRAVAAMFGPNPSGFYLAKLAALGLTSVIAFAVVHRLTRQWGPAVLASLLLCLGPGTAETFYTLGKPESHAVLFLLAGLLALAHATRATGIGRYGLLAGTWAALLAAALWKESALVAVPAAAATLVLLRVGGPGTGGATCRPASGLALAALLALAGYVVVVYVLAGTALPWAPEAYRGSRVRPLIAPGWVFCHMWRHNLNVLALSLGAGACSILAVRRREALREPAVGAMLFCTLCTFGQVAFYVCIWQDALPYLYYPAAATGAIAVALGLARAGVLADSARGQRALRAGLAALLFVAVGWGLPATVNMARAHLAWSRANDAAVRWTAALPRGSVVLLNCPADMEFVYQWQVLLRLCHGRDDVYIAGVRDPSVAPPVPPGKVYLLVNHGAAGNRRLGGRTLMISAREAAMASPDVAETVALAEGAPLARFEQELRVWQFALPPLVEAKFVWEAYRLRGVPPYAASP